MREKLIELLQNAKAAMKSEKLPCDIARNMFVVDFMMANGVTVQRWIPVAERLPEVNEAVLVYDGQTVDGFSFMNLSYVSKYGITHWMPLPDPPKGE